MTIDCRLGPEDPCWRQGRWVKNGELSVEREGRRKRTSIGHRNNPAGPLPNQPKPLVDSLGRSL